MQKIHTNKYTNTQMQWTVPAGQNQNQLSQRCFQNLLENTQERIYVCQALSFLYVMSYSV